MADGIGAAAARRLLRLLRNAASRRCELPAAAAAAGLLALAACGDGAPPAPVLPRHERWAIFRDLVLIERHDSRGGPYFLDRFEVSRRDFAEWLHAVGAAAPSHQLELVTLSADADQVALRPIARVDLPTAREYARWRFCRLPTAGEWEYAASAGGAYRYPWGDHSRAEWANAPELGLLQTAAIGTFESGRALNGPYDLVGNVAEWTETLSPSAVRDLAAATVPRAMEVWSLPGQPVPSLALLCAAPRPAARLVVGGAFVGLGDMAHGGIRFGQVPTLSCQPHEWSDTTGIRLAADPQSVLVELLREPALPAPAELDLVRDFLGERKHRAVLAPALASAAARVEVPGPLAAILAAVLAP